MFRRAVDAKQKLEIALQTEQQDKQTLAAKLKKVLFLFSHKFVQFSSVWIFVDGAENC